MGAQRGVREVDGTRDRPPGKTAQIAGRKDGIRAGAVSGPWRSGPTVEATPTRKPGPPRPPSQKSPERSTPAPTTPEAVLARPPLAEQAERIAVPRASRQTTRSIAWVAVGVLIAVGAVVAAFLFRPSPETPRAQQPTPLQTTEQSTPPQAPQQPAPPQATNDTATAAAPAAPTRTEPPQAAAGAPALSRVSVVRLRVGPGFPAERQAAILAALNGAGIANVRIELLPFEVATSRVGYYRADDVAAADALARLITPVVGAGDGEVGVRDYGKLLDDAEPGRLDLWVGN